MSQAQTILNILKDGQPHCSNELRDLFVPEYRSRINELRKQGYTIKGYRCNLHQHRGNSQMWVLLENQTQLNAPQPERTEQLVSISTGLPIIK